MKNQKKKVKLNLIKIKKKDFKRKKQEEYRKYLDQQLQELNERKIKDKRHLKGLDLIQQQKKEQEIRNQNLNQNLNQNPQNNYFPLNKNEFSEEKKFEAENKSTKNAKNLLNQQEGNLNFNFDNEKKIEKEIEKRKKLEYQQELIKQIEAKKGEKMKMENKKKEEDIAFENKYGNYDYFSNYNSKPHKSNKKDKNAVSANAPLEFQKAENKISNNNYNTNTNTNYPIQNIQNQNEEKYMYTNNNNNNNNN